MKKKIYNKLYQYFNSKQLVTILVEIIMIVINLILNIYFKLRKMRKKNQLNYSIEKSLEVINRLHNNGLKSNQKISRKNERIYDLSIIVPVYNGEKYVKKCLDSIFNQITKYNYQVIIINDGSTDNTYHILKKFQFENLVIINQDNQGISVSRNKGLELAEGKYIMFVDCDDFIYPNSIELLLNKAMEYNVDIVEGNYNRVTEIGREYCNYTVENKFNYIDLVQNPNKILETVSYPWGRVYSYKLWEDIIFPIGLDYEDTIIKALVFRKANSYIKIPDVVYGYYIGNTDSITAKLNGTSKGLDSYYIIEYIISENKKLSLIKNQLFYKIILHQMGSILYERTIFLTDKERMYLLVLMRDLIINNNISDIRDLTFKEKHMLDSIQNLDVFKWKICCKFL